MKNENDGKCRSGKRCLLQNMQRRRWFGLASACHVDYSRNPCGYLYCIAATVGIIFCLDRAAVWEAPAPRARAPRAPRATPAQNKTNICVRGTFQLILIRRSDDNSGRTIDNASPPGLPGTPRPRTHPEKLARSLCPCITCDSRSVFIFHVQKMVKNKLESTGDRN